MAEPIKPLVNRVANSGLVVFNLEDHFPEKEMVEMDIKPLLFKELILKEKDFRTALKEKNWEDYRDKIVLVFVSNDAIIPVWAYMLISSYLTDIAAECYQGTKDDYLKLHYSKLIEAIDSNDYDNQKLIIKGCSNKPVPPSAYAAITSKLKPVARSIMYGEPCSTVPIYKRPRKV